MSALKPLTAETAAELERLRADNDALLTSLRQCLADLGKAQADVAEDLPRLRTNLKGWSERGRKAEAELKSARIRVAELEARAAAGPDAEWFLAQYEGTGPDLFATEAAAREFCDELAAGELDGCWDWFPDGDGFWRQVRTSDLDDRPLGEAPGSVLRLSVRGAAGELARLLAERHETNEVLHDAIVAERGAGSPAAYPPALPWAALMDDEDLHDFLDDLQGAAMALPWADADKVLAEVEKTIGTWRAIAEAQHAHNTAPGPDAVAGDRRG